MILYLSSPRITVLLFEVPHLKYALHVVRREILAPIYRSGKTTPLEFGAESMIHRAARRSIGYANAAVLHPRGLPFPPVSSLSRCLTILCSDKTCHPPRHIAYDPDRTAGKTNGRDAKTSSSHSRPGLFRDEDSAPDFLNPGSSAGREREREGEI